MKILKNKKGQDMMVLIEYGSYLLFIIFTIVFFFLFKWSQGSELASINANSANLAGNVFLTNYLRTEVQTDAGKITVADLIINGYGNDASLSLLKSKSKEIFAPLTKDYSCISIIIEGYPTILSSRIEFEPFGSCMSLPFTQYTSVMIPYNQTNKITVYLGIVPK